MIETQSISFHMPFLSNNRYIHTFESNKSMKLGNKYFYFIINSFIFTICHYSSLFVTIRQYLSIFSLFVTIRHYSSLFVTICQYSHYSSLFVNILTIRQYLSIFSLFVTIRHYSSIFVNILTIRRYSSLFATICIIRSLFVTIRDYLHYSGYIASTAMFLLS